MVRLTYIAVVLSIFLYSTATAQILNRPLSDSLLSDSLLTDSTQIDLINPDSGMSVDLPTLPPLAPPVRLIDSLVDRFGRDRKIFDVNQNDMYPRNGAGFLFDEASYFSMTRHETPLRNVIIPFGVPGGRMNIRSGVNPIIINDVIIPQDGRMDFDEVGTGDVVSATILEGPLSDYGSLAGTGGGGGGLSMLYLEPAEIPEDLAQSQFTLERGAYGYSYTRARIGRMFSGRTGFSLSSDYRKGDGIGFTIDDDAYHVNTHLFKKIKRRSVVDLYINVYRREGAFPVFQSGRSITLRRLRREQQLIGSYTLLDVAGGQFTGRINSNTSRASYGSYTIKPENKYLELSFLKSTPKLIWELTAIGGTDKVDINLFAENDTSYLSRKFASLSFSALLKRSGLDLFTTVRLRGKEATNPTGDASIGISKKLFEKFRLMTSVGWHHRDPQLWEDADGLKRAKELTGNATLIYASVNTKLSLSLNLGRLTDALYFDFRQGSQSYLESFPANDEIDFADLNLKADFKQIGPFYSLLSGTIRKVDSKRYGNRPPYSPRWQLFGRVGLKYFVNRYKVNLRLFGDINYTEKPLSYRLEELNTTVTFNWGFNAALKDLTFYYLMHNATNQIIEQPEFYGYTGWFYSWGINWKFFD